MNRRKFLRGVCGATLCLPFLESLVSSRDAAAGPGDPARRLIVFFMCNGVNMDMFFPATSYGALTDASFAGRGIEPLMPFRQKLLIPRGMHMVPRGFGWDPTAGDDHAKGMGCKLTAQPLIDGSTYAAGISLDQFVANKLNPPNTPALNLMVGYKSTSVLGHISYTGPEQPVTAENNPWLAYQDLVGLQGLDDEAAQRLLARRESVLDLVGEEYQALLSSKKLSQADHDKLDAHFTAVRDLENGMIGNGVIACVLDETRAAEIQGINPDSVANDSEFKAIGRMQMDIIAMAIACGANNAATLQWGSGAGGPIFKWDGMNHDYNHHKLSHGNTADDNSGGEVAGYEGMLHAIDTWFAGEFAYLLGKLDGYVEADGKTVLDNTAAVWMNELSHGKDHDFRDMPVIIAGGAGGYLKQGEYIKVTAQADTKNDTDAPHNRLLTTLANAVGCTEEGGGAIANFGSFGEPGEFDALKA